MGKALAAAGIEDPELARSYELCRQINAQHGRTYYLATLLLPPAKRPFVHALYGMARYADDIVDTVDGRSVQQRSGELDHFRVEFLTDLAAGHSHHPVAAATIDTAVRWNIRPEFFVAFFDSMQMDLTISTYPTFDDLARYVYGSAAVIGLQMVPILEPRADSAYESARDLGIAFQLANFIRDVGEDLDRNRIYLPLDELATFGLTATDIRARKVSPAFQNALAHQIERVRRLQQQATPGIELLAPDSQPCIRTASTLYCGIVDEVERNGYDVFTRRAKVPLRRRLSVALPAFAKARRARHR